MQEIKICQIIDNTDKVCNYLKIFPVIIIGLIKCLNFIPNSKFPLTENI